MIFLQLNSTCGVKSIEHLFEVLPNCNFLKSQISVVSSFNLSCDFFCSRWAHLLDQSSRLLGWPFKILKAPNPTGQPTCSKKNSAMFKSSHPASSMAWSSAYRNLCQNPLFDGKNKLAGGTPTKGSNCRTSVPATTRVSTPAIAPVVAPLVASGSVDSFMVRYLEDELQQIVKTILEAMPLPLLAPAPVPAFVIAATLHYKSPHKLPLKTQFSDIYWGKTYLKCYNFF